MKKNSKWLALLLAGAMTVSPLSYVNAYAAEADTVTYSAEAVTNSADTVTYSVDAATNSAGATTNSAGATTNSADTVTNSADAATNSAGATTNSADAATNSADTVTNSAGAATNSTDTVTNSAGAATNSTDTATNSANAATNSTDTVTNSADAATNNADAVTQAQEKNGEVQTVTGISGQDATAVKTPDETNKTSAQEESKETNTQAPVVTGDAVRIVKGDGSDYKMCVVSKSEVSKVDGKLKVTFETGSVTYSGIYFGTKDDENKTPVIEGTELGNGGWSFVFEVDTAKAGQVVPIALRKKDGEWYTKTSLWMYIPAPKESEKPDSGQTPDTGIPEDAVYSIDVESSSSMFKIVNCELTVKAGKMTAIVTLSGTGYGYLYAGTGEQAASADQSTWIAYKENANREYTYELPVEALDKGIAVAAYSIKNKKWYDRELIFKSETMKKIGDVNNGSDNQDPTPGTEAAANGIYSIDVDSSSSMFRIVDCQMTIKNGKMTAVLTLSGTGYGYLYAGTAAQAAAAESSSWVPFKVNADGKYTYEIPVEALDKGIAVAAYSIKNEKWYDRELTFKSETMKKIGDVEDGSDTPDPTPTPGTDDSKKDDNKQDDLNQGTETPSGNDGKTDNESKYESDTSGSTSRVDSSTGLKDGVYTPDRFTWSGGTGKVKISCNKITIKNGQAYATLVFSSNHYQYVKANGNTYYTTKSGSTATVTIPVSLNKNNTILGMTDKMSVAHEIEYSIFVYLASANGAVNGSDADGGQTVDNTALAEKAPEIMGLEYESETKLEYAEYFKIYHYDQGIVLLEIDMTKDTARDDKNNKTSDDKSEKASDEQKTTSDNANTSADEEMDSTDNNGAGKEELAAELYKGNIVNYLLVPEGVEIPVGLEQDMIIVKLPANKTYAASKDILETMKDLDLLENVAAVGMEKDDCSISEIADKMEAKDGEDAEVAFGGLFEQPDLKALVKQETNLALLPAKFLPMDTEENKKDSEAAEDSDNEAVSESANPEGDLTAEEQEELFEKVTEKFAMLGIPVIVDRSSQEKTDLAKMEWIKVYGVLYGCEDKMNDKFDAAVKAAEK